MATADHPGSHAATTGTMSRKDRAGSALSVKPTRGLVSGLLLILLGIWTGLIHFVGPYFAYQADTAGAWAFSWDRLWFGIVPGVVAIIGGAMLGPARDRATGSLGAWLGLASGVWLILGPTLAGIWEAAGPSSVTMSMAEQIGLFYGLGAVITAISAFAAGRMATRSVRDVKD